MSVVVTGRLASKKVRLQARLQASKATRLQAKNVHLPIVRRLAGGRAAGSRPTSRLLDAGVLHATHTHTRTHTHACTHARKHASTHAHARVRTHIHAYTHAYVQLIFYILNRHTNALLTRPRAHQCPARRSLAETLQTEAYRGR